MWVSRRNQPFAWSESRPDGRRTIRNHHHAHGRAVRAARRVVDTSPPRCFRARLARQQQAPRGAVPPAPAAYDASGAPLPAAAGAYPGLQRTPYRSSCVEDYRHRSSLHTQPPLQAAATQYQPSGGHDALPPPHSAPRTAPPRPSSAPIGGRRAQGGAAAGPWGAAGAPRPKVTAQPGAPVPGAAAAAAAASAASEASGPPADAPDGGDAGTRGDGCTAGDGLERLSYAFSDEQMGSFDGFVGLLAQFDKHDMETILAAAVQEAEERQLLANYRS